VSKRASTRPSWTSWGCPLRTWLDAQRFPPSPTWSEAHKRTAILPS
jgi:hypothetical protein